MVAAELTPTQQTSCPGLSAGAVVGMTALGIGLALLDPALAGSARPHPTLTGSVDEAAGILQNNARVLAAPFLLIALGFPQSRLGRHAGDIIVTALTAASTIPVGLELGRWQGRLLPTPAAPSRMGSLGSRRSRLGGCPSRSRHAPPTGVAGRRGPGPADVRGLPGDLGTPHRHGHRLGAARDLAVWRAAGCLSPGSCTAAGPVASRSHAPFPSLRSVPLGRIAGAAGISSTNRPPQGGIT